MGQSVVGVQLGLCAEAFTTGNAREWLVSGVNSHVSGQCSLLEELLPAQGTRMWNTSVQFTVVHQLKFTREGSTTVRAHERIQRTVEPRVHDQMLLLGKTFATVLAHVRTLSGVELAVGHQVTLQWERSTTFLAHKRSLSAVDPRVCQQMMLQREALFTFLALVGTVCRVQQQMGVQTMFVGEILATVHAHMRSFTSMDTSMCCKMMLQQEGLSALITRVGTLFGHYIRRRCV